MGRIAPVSLTARRSWAADRSDKHRAHTQNPIASRALTHQDSAVGVAKAPSVESRRGQDARNALIAGRSKKR